MGFFDGNVARFGPPVVWRKGESVDHNKLNAMMVGFVRLITVGRGLRKVESADGSQVMIALSDDAKPLAGFWALVQSAAKQSGQYRWEYTIQEVGPKTAAKWDGWAVSPTAIDRKAYNSSEYINEASADPFGNGVTPGNLPDGFELQPVPNGTPVWVTPVIAADGEGDSLVEFWFTSPNGVDGTCPDEGTP